MWPWVARGATNGQSAFPRAHDSGSAVPELAYAGRNIGAKGAAMGRTPPPERPGDLSPAQQAQLRALLIEALRHSYAEAAARGADKEALALDIERRRRALADELSGRLDEAADAVLAEDTEHAPDDPRAL